MPEKIEIPCCDGENGEIGSPYIFFPLYENDMGRRHGRTSRNEFIKRKPVAVSNFGHAGLRLKIENSGLVPSDLVMIEYQVVYCTAFSHNDEDGFIKGQSKTIHYSEERSKDIDSYLTIDYVPAKSSIYKDINFQPIEYIQSVYNIYFRAKVSTVWHESAEMKDWDFANDVTVIEAHHRLK